MQHAAWFSKRQNVTLHGLKGSQTELSRPFANDPRHRLAFLDHGTIFRCLAQIGRAMSYDVHFFHPTPKPSLRLGT